MNVEVKILLGVIENRTNISYEDIQGPSRKREVIYARRIFCAMARKYLHMTHKNIAIAIGNRDHSSVIYHIKKHDDEIDIYVDYRNTYRDVYKSTEAIFVIKTEYSPEYIKYKLIDLLDKRNKLNEQILMYTKRIKELNKFSNATEEIQS